MLVVSLIITERKWKGRINHIFLGLNSSDEVEILENGWKVNPLIMDSPCVSQHFSVQKKTACIWQTLPPTIFTEHYWFNAFSALSLFPAVPSRLMTTMRCLTRRGCWLPKCMRATSHTSWTAYCMDMTTNLDLTLEVGPDFSHMIRLVTDSQKTYAHICGYICSQTCMWCLPTFSKRDS